MNTDDGDKREWFLRISNGVVFGPVPTVKLCQWAEQGRVQPGNDVSEDRISWIPVQDVPELDFNWFLEDGDGNLTGPFNKRVAERLLSDGRVGEGTSILPREAADLSRLRQPAGEKRRRSPADGHPEFELETPGEAEAAAALEGADAEWAAEREDFRLRIEQLESEKRKILSVAEKDRKAAGRSLDAEREKREECLEEIGRLKEEDRRFREESAAAASKAAAEAAEAASRFQGQIAALKAEVEASRRSLEESRQARAREAEEAKAAGKQAVDEATGPLLKRIQTLESDLRASASAAAEAEPDPRKTEEIAENAAAPFKARIAALEGELAREAARADAAAAGSAEAVALATRPLQARIAELEAVGEKAAADGRAASERAVSEATAEMKGRLSACEEELRTVRAELETSRLMCDAVTADAAADAAEPLQDQVASLLSRLAQAEKRADEAAARRVETEKAVSNATAPLYARIDELEKEARATAGRTRQAVAEATAALEERVAALGARGGELEARNAELDAKIARMEDSIATGEKQRKSLEEGLSEARERADKMARECAAVKSDYTELLAYSNQRDAEANERIDKASKSIDELKSRNEALQDKLGQQDKSRLAPVIAGLSERDSKTLDQIVTSEREFLNGLRDEWQKQQRVVQERLAELARLHGGELAGAAKREAAKRAERSELVRAKQMLESLRHDYAVAMKQGERRERELNQQIRKLETENDRAKDLADDSDNLRQKVKQLSEMLHERDQTLAKERQDRSIERTRFEQAQVAMSRRIENLQDAGTRLSFPDPGDGSPAAENDKARPAPGRAPDKKAFRSPPWIQLKK